MRERSANLSENNIIGKAFPDNDNNPVPPERDSASHDSSDQSIDQNATPASFVVCIPKDWPRHQPNLPEPRRKTQHMLTCYSVDPTAYNVHGDDLDWHDDARDDFEKSSSWGFARGLNFELGTPARQLNPHAEKKIVSWVGLATSVEPRDSSIPLVGWDSALGTTPTRLTRRDSSDSS
ncbi:hypothetical protein PSTG_12917 [Puccinia striiformis f. sp. tritici PST-78]|uniref:Uncharacterized protein n=1 Tax=Puccinia striiformis f. sp. tritici PST-78 TaxID=1165861 RepID=A0A0L0V419_9BASI|nr:hypothetical protein PSTG_12917 [Puccinia striiformis f. sp. tritici PST-78]